MTNPHNSKILLSNPIFSNTNINTINNNTYINSLSNFFNTEENKSESSISDFQYLSQIRENNKKKLKRIKIKPKKKFNYTENTIKNNNRFYEYYKGGNDYYHACTCYACLFGNNNYCKGYSPLMCLYNNNKRKRKNKKLK